MDCIKITGGNKLQGKVEISGSKNAALPAFCACLLAGGATTLRNVPQLRDIDTIIKLLNALEVGVKPLENGAVTVDATQIGIYEALYDLVKTMRASVMVLGPLLARTGHARVSLPGGCAIGTRPIDMHLEGLRAMGAEIELDHGYINARANRLRGADISFKVPTVTGTENLMMAACLARGVTVLRNASREPEVVFLAQMLNSMGAKITGAGAKTITICGVDELSPTDTTVIPDRIETGTYMIAAAITGGRIEISGCDPNHIRNIQAKLLEASVQIREDRDTITIEGVKPITPVDFSTAPYPDFPTDMQAQMTALLSLACGSSTLTETIFENRFMHVAELKRMGANIALNGNSALVKGVEKLEGATVMATDLRASASLILAGLAAEGETIVSRIYHIDRGYENIESKLTALGACIERMPEEKAIASLRT